jgi:hypothetical protein
MPDTPSDSPSHLSNHDAQSCQSERNAPFQYSGAMISAAALTSHDSLRASVPSPGPVAMESREGAGLGIPFDFTFPNFLDLQPGCSTATPTFVFGTNVPPSLSHGNSPVPLETADSDQLLGKSDQDQSSLSFDDTIAFWSSAPSSFE